METRGKRGRLRYRIVWREGGRGSKRHISELFVEKAKALDALNEKNDELAATKKVGTRLAMSWGEVRQRWKRAKLSEGSGNRYVDEAMAAMKRHTDDWKTVKDVSAQALRDMPIGARRYSCVCLKWAADELNQPVDLKVIKLSKRKGRTVTKPPRDLISEWDEICLMAAASNWCQGALGIGHLVARYGHRAESLVGLPPEGIDLRRKKITIIVKSGDEITHPLLDESVDILSPMVKAATPGKPMFLAPNGLPWKDGHSFAGWWYHRIGERVTPYWPGYYCLKSKAITTLLDLGVSLDDIQKITGHRSKVQLLKYVRTNEVRQALAMEKLEASRRPPAHDPESSRLVAG